ncbi:MAG: HIT family protein [Phycisphaerae bacterium]|nr:HIT family protein [Phycisphaerae bacterium]
MMTDCIFCKIIAGNIPCAKIYEDDATLAFLDIGPCSDGHTLVIPKKHYETLDQCDPETMAAVGETLTNVALALVNALDIHGYNVVCNNGSQAGQEVPHLHFHIIPCKGNQKCVKLASQGQYAPGQMENIRKTIADALAR